MGGEPLTILDSQAIKKTTTQLRLFLESKGYFRSETDYQVTFSNKKARVNYNVVENRPYIIDSLVLRSNNQRITALINAFQEESLLQEGENYDQENLTNETNRIENLLRDNGYFDFGKRFIDFDVDTAYGDHKVAIRTVISEAPEGTHRIFKIDSVLFTTDANLRNLNQERYNINFNGITYKYFRDMYSLKVLDRRIFLKPGQLYSLANTRETQRQLTNMNVFRFVNVNYDSTGGGICSQCFCKPP